MATDWMPQRWLNAERTADVAVNWSISTGPPALLSGSPALPTLLLTSSVAGDAAAVGETPPRCQIAAMIQYLHAPTTEWVDCWSSYGGSCRLVAGLQLTWQHCSRQTSALSSIIRLLIAAAVAQSQLHKHRLRECRVSATTRFIVTPFWFYGPQKPRCIDWRDCTRDQWDSIDPHL